MGILIAILAVLAVGAGGAALYFRHRYKKVTPAAGVVFEGAARAIMEGEYPGLERLLAEVPGLPRMRKKKAPSQKAVTRPQAARGAARGEITQVQSAGGETGSLKADAADQGPATAVRPAAKKGAAGKEENGAGEAAAAPAGGDEAQVPAHIFREYDVRGLVDKELNPKTMRLIGRAIGVELRNQGRSVILVGRDGRNSSVDLVKGLIKGLVSEGINVRNLGMVPTPVLYFAQNHQKIQDGVVVTGSHNNDDYNGLKIVVGGAPLWGERIRALYHSIQQGMPEHSGRGRMQTMNFFTYYVQRLLDEFPKSEISRKIVVDCANGMAGSYVPFLLRKLGHQVTELACGLAQTSSGADGPDPTVPANLETLRDRVRKTDAELGLAYDGDGDRLVVIDGEGEIVWPDRILMLFSKDVLSRNPGGTIIFDVKCSNRLASWIEEHKGKPFMWKTGHSLIRGKMAELDACLAGEFSGHIFFGERWYGFDDAIYATCRLLEVLAQDRRSPTEVLRELPGGIGSPEYRIPVAEGTAPELVRRFQEECRKQEGARLIDIDGIRVEYPDRWGLLRPSNTSPSLVLRFEGQNQDALSQIQKQFGELLLRTDPALTLPF
ncbi:MAG: phosphomannomutase/phosphoglucomutase [Gammaproteobacteria bacterium]|nr:phosphomannomutase/phosphoglucomutase [Gammaproteobacteria bacterium]